MIFDDFQKEIVENDYWNRIILYIIKYIIVSRGIIEFNRKRKKFWKHFSFVILIHFIYFQSHRLKFYSIHIDLRLSIADHYLVKIKMTHVQVKITFAQKTFSAFNYDAFERLTV